MDEMIQPRNKELFNKSACSLCGDCLHLCPELNLPINVAKEEKKLLIAGEGSKYVLSHCTTCFSCNLLCPNDCKPYELILENWNSLYLKRGAPPIYRFVCPTLEKNIWQMLMVFMSKEEKNRVNNWMNQELKGTILLIGNYTHLFSFIVGDSKLLDFFTPVDLIDQWEGGAYLYQGGYLDVVKKIGEKCKKDFDTAGIKIVVPFLDAVQYMFDIVHPQQMGTPFNQEFINFNKWLLDKIQNGEIELPNQLNMNVTIHDNCYSKANGELYWNSAREIIKLTGCKISEMEHIKKDALCCGFGEGASWTKNISIVFDILSGTKKKFEEAEATGAEALITYCSGCLYLLWAGKILFKSKLKVFHSIELVRLAMGEDVDVNQKAHVNRAWDIITIITYHLIISIFHKKFFIEELSFKDQRWKKRYFFTVKIMRFFFRIFFIQAIYRWIFKILLSKMKTKRTWGMYC